VIDYRDDLTRQGLRSSTIAVRLAALASFYGEAKTRGLVERDPAEGVDRPTVAAYAAARWLTTGEASPATVVGR
jgi:site-specific recombinase XerC